ncbi:hypothetical protein KI387_001801 [Taxus chinensis]|uniref:Protein CMSS1 n=1 Tax=Taxus chinensis TaxID=29808 RepID=A0AA38GVF4_TAXCH|nr:hypothetical protein KI387_001801 [Taxus chinensis]
MAKKFGENQKHSKKKNLVKSPFNKVNLKSKKTKAQRSKIEEVEEKSPSKQLRAADKIVTDAKIVSKPGKHNIGGKSNVGFESCAEQLNYFLNAFQTATGTHLSSLELQEIPGNCMRKLSNDMDRSVQNLGKHVKAMFGPSWKEVLCEGNLIEGNVEPGSPAILMICSSAARCVETLRGLREFTAKCNAAKLFAKHIKIEEQVSMLKGRVNIAGGTPSRIKSLIDNDALGISRLSILLLDFHKDAKGLTLFSLPQVREIITFTYDIGKLNNSAMNDPEVALNGIKINHPKFGALQQDIVPQVCKSYALDTFWGSAPLWAKEVMLSYELPDMYPSAVWEVCDDQGGEAAKCKGRGEQPEDLEMCNGC